MDPATLQPPQGPRTDPGTLFVVATPIGNLEDITLRALRILKEVTVVAAEDTRRTGNLLRHYQIETPLVSLHEHNERHRLRQLVARLQNGESIALVSDAGTPGISDPGALLVSAARGAGIRVDPVPGPSAVTATLSASGLSFERFVFAGFPPVRSKDRKRWFEWVAQQSDTPIVFFEAPHRIVATLQQARALLVNRPMILARELTKAHEEWIFVPLAGGAPSDAIESALHNVKSRGEFVVILGESTNTDGDAARTSYADADIVDLFGQMTENNGVSTRREAINAVATRLGLSSKAVYEALERAKKEPA